MSGTFLFSLDPQNLIGRYGCSSLTYKETKAQSSEELYRFIKPLDGRVESLNISSNATLTVFYKNILAGIFKYFCVIASECQLTDAQVHPLGTEITMLTVTSLGQYIFLGISNFLA